MFDNNSQIGKLATLAMVFTVLISAFAVGGAMAEEEDDDEAYYFVSTDNIESTDGVYDEAFEVVDGDSITAVDVTDFEFTDAATDGADDVTISIEDGEGTVVAEDTHVDLSDAETHDLSSTFDINVAEDDEYTVVVESAEGIDFTAASLDVTGDSESDDGGPGFISDNTDSLIVVALIALALFVLGKRD